VEQVVLVARAHLLFPTGLADSGYMVDGLGVKQEWVSNRPVEVG